MSEVVSRFLHKMKVIQADHVKKFIKKLIQALKDLKNIFNLKDIFMVT